MRVRVTEGDQLILNCDVADIAQHNSFIRGLVQSAIESPSGESQTKDAEGCIVTAIIVPSKPNIDECPICGGNIQATIECWYSDLTLSADGQTVVSKGSLDSQDEGEIQVYCENDHTQAEMVEWIKTGKPSWEPKHED